MGAIPTELGNLSNLQSLLLGSNQLTGEIPISLTNLTRLISYWADISYNALHTLDAGLIAFLNSKASDWAATQTIAPANVAATPVNSTTINLTWDAIPYSGDTGGYRISVGTSAGGSYTFFQQTTDKTITSMPVTGLNPGTPYYFVISTRTDPNGSSAEHSREREQRRKNRRPRPRSISSLLPLPTVARTGTAGPSIILPGPRPAPSPTSISTIRLTVAPIGPRWQPVPPTMVCMPGLFRRSRLRPIAWCASAIQSMSLLTM